MQLLYDSLTGNVRRFTRQLQADFLARYGVELEAIDLRRAAPTGDYLLLTYTFNQGNIPDTTAKFLQAHAAGMRGVVASGSFHWGENFGRAGDLIAAQYGVPFIARLNKGGTVKDREEVLLWLAKVLKVQETVLNQEEVA